MQDGSAMVISSSLGPWVPSWACSIISSYYITTSGYKLDISVTFIPHVGNMPQDVYWGLDVQADVWTHKASVYRSECIYLARMGMMQEGLACSNICLSTKASVKHPVAFQSTLPRCPMGFSYITNNFVPTGTSSYTGDCVYWGFDVAWYSWAPRTLMNAWTPIFMYGHSSSLYGLPSSHIIWCCCALDLATPACGHCLVD